MSMSISVIAFKAPDAKWHQMKAVWDACNTAGIAPPKNVDRYFEGAAPDERGVEVEIEKTACCHEYHAEMEDGFEVEIAKLPKDVTHIRFYNSY